MTLAQCSDDLQGQAMAAGGLANVYLLQGDLEKALDFCEQGLSISREIGYRQGELSGLGTLANVHLEADDVETAIAYFRDILEIAEEIQSKQTQGIALQSLGVAYSERGEYEEAWEYLRRSFAIAQDMDDYSGQAAALSNMGIVLTHLIQYDEAQDCLEAAATMLHYPCSTSLFSSDMSYNSLAHQGRTNIWQRSLKCRFLHKHRQISKEKTQGYIVLPL